MSNMRFSGLLVLLAFVAPAHAADRLQIVHAGQLLDQPDKPARGPSSLLIRNDKVESVRDGYVDAAGFELVPAGVEMIDLREYFVLPGLIDSHVHLTTDKAGVEAQLWDVSASVATKAYEAAVNAKKTLDAGFTTVRNLGDGDGVILALRDAVATGQLPGPRILDAGVSISVTAGHMDPTLGFAEGLHAALSTSENLCDGVESCRRAVRKQIGRGADVIKIATTGGVNSRIGAGVGQQMFEDEARAIVETAHLAGKKVAVHAHGGDGVKVALRAGADSIEHGTLLDDEGVALFKSSGAYYVPTLSTINGYNERLAKNPEAYTGAVLEKIKWRIGITGKSLAMAVPRGVKIAFGTDAGVSLHGRNADEFELMVKFGMTAQQAIVAATTNAADLLGVGDQVGDLAAGKQADLIAVRGNPLEDVTVLKNVRVVMKGGQIYKNLSE